MPWLDALILLGVGLSILLRVASVSAAGLAPGEAGWALGNACSSIGLVGAPLLLMCCGAIMLQPGRDESIAGFYRKRLPRLLVPLLAWSGIYYLYGALAAHAHGLDWREFLSLAATNGVEGQLLLAYLLVQIFLAVPFLRLLLHRVDRGCSLAFVVVCFALQSANPYMEHFLGTKLKIEQTMFTVGLGYFALGRFLTDAGQARTPSRGWLAALFALGVAVTALGNWLLRDAAGLDRFLFMKFDSPNILLCAWALFLLGRSLRLSKDGRLVRWLAVASGGGYGAYLSYELLRRLLVDLGWRSQPAAAGWTLWLGDCIVQTLVVGACALALAALGRKAPPWARVLC